MLAGKGGRDGNGAALLDELVRALAPLTVESIVLADAPRFATHEAAIARASLLVFVTGTYWDGWSSHLQLFLEEATSTEATALWLGKPAVVVALAHSVGAKGVVSRLQGVLVSLGCAIPPLSGVALTWATELARRAAPEHAGDFFSLDDVRVAIDNAKWMLALDRAALRAWPVDRGDPSRRWWPVGDSRPDSVE